jgi:hypothetical protein
MTGGCHADVRVLLQKNDKGEDVRREIIEPCRTIKISDSALSSFELWVPVRLIPLGLKIGDVIRIKSVVASILADFKHVLVPTDHSNLLLIHPTFKLYKRFHNKEQSTMHDLTLAILGCSNKPINQRQNNSEDAQAQNGIRIQLTHVTGQGEKSSEQVYCIADPVLEKPEIVSNVGSLYKNV